MILANTAVWIGGVVTIIVALIGAVGGYWAAKAPAKLTTEEKAAKDLFGSYQTYAEEIRKQMADERKEFKARLEAVDKEHEEERTQWHKERAELKERIEELEGIVFAMKRSIRPPRKEDR